MPPTDIDVRHSVRAAIEAGAANATIQVAPAGQSIMDDLAQLTQSLFTRLVLGGCAALAAFSLWSGLDTVAGLSVVADLQGGLFLSSYLTP